MISTATGRGDRVLKWIDDKFLGKTLGERLRRRKARRIVALTGIVLALGFGFIMGYAAWSLIAPNPVSMLEKFLSAFFWVALFSCFLIPPLVQMAVGSVVALPNQPYDERQKQLFIEARSKAFEILKTLLLVAMAIGLTMLIAVIAGRLPWSHPVYGGIPFYVGLSAMIFLLASLSPYLILAWQLPDELDVDDDS